MKFMIYFLTLVLLIISLNTQQPNAPTPPTWANKWTASFSEQMSLGFIKGSTTGVFYYDYTSMRYRIDRANGKIDRYCGSVEKFVDTPCNQYVDSGNRYLDFPAKNYCCFCCNAEHGCGILKPDWMSTAKFQNYIHDKGQVYENFLIKGGQSNFIWTTSDGNQLTYKIDQQPDDVMEFDLNTYKTTFDASLLTLPSRCKLTEECTTISTCGALRTFA